MNRQIDYFFEHVEECVLAISDEIVTAFEQDANEENVEYSFTISRASGEITNRNANTLFKFDTKEGTVLDQFKKALYAEDLEDIEKDSWEEKEFINSARDIIVKICERITGELVDRMKETVRRVVLDDRVDENTTPLKEIQIINLDIADYSSIPESSKYLLKIGKVPGTNINTDYVVEYIQDRQEETGEDVQTILDLEHMAGNPEFENVIAVERSKKYINDVTLYMFVDYSLNIDEGPEENSEENIDKE